MKNNELLLTIKFESIDEEISLLLNNDITLRTLLEVVYYGLKKNVELVKYYLIFDDYVKKHDQIVVFYRAKSELNLICVKDDFDKKLYKLGIVTTSCIVIPETDRIELKELFPCYAQPSLCNKEKMEYNISTRRITVAEPSVIDVLPPGEFPKGQKRNLLDVILPTLISMSALFFSRVLLKAFGDDATGFSILAMMMTTSVSTMVIQTYNFIKQGKVSEKSVEEWKTNYEKYLTRIWNRILEWQKSDINYLRTTYPEIKELFKRTACLDRAIFARSQSDLDFLKITLGASGQVVPMFEIKNEKKDEIVSEIEFKVNEGNEKCRIEIIIPPPEEHEPGIIKKFFARFCTLKKNVTAISSGSKGDNYLSELPDCLANKYFRYLKAENTDGLPPLVLDLKNSGALGIIEETAEYSEKFIEHIVFELVYYHTPEDLQIVFFFNQEDDRNRQTEKIKNYKNLPHTNELFEDVSQFVFDKESAAIVFGKLQAIMGERTKEKNDKNEENVIEEQMTQILCIVFDDYDIKETGFSKYLPKPPLEGDEYINTNGLTFIFVRRQLAQLPRYCGNIIEVINSNGEHAKVSNRYNVLSRETLNQLSTSRNDNSNTTNDIEFLIDYKKFSNDYIFYDNSRNGGGKIREEYETAFRQLSAIHYRRIAENGNVPSLVTLFELYNYKPEMVSGNEILNKILDNWATSDVTQNLSVPIGKNEHGVVYLDLYEKEDGPHMLVAGTTGSGKSETIITYLIGLCMKFSPTYLNLMLVDMKGGGFSNRLQALPHCVGVVDDTAGESEGISAIYMLKRFLEVLNAEIKRRKILLKRFGVDNVDAYIRAERTISQILNKNDENSDLIKMLNPEQEKQLLQLKQKKEMPETLSHLVLVVDEFTELKRFSNESGDIDFIAEITTIARVGRTLGFHIILASQNIEGAITDDIRINTKSRICLKVATRTASKEMLDGRTDAASPTMPGNGRAYLLVGTGSKFIYFQSAYTGANQDEKIEPVVKATQVLPCGKHKKDFYISTEHNDRIKYASKEVNEHETQLRYIVELIKGINRSYRTPRVIFKKPLKSKTPDPTKWRE